jgi:tRNA(Arg) A34 adenosine deaminase TadA
MQKHEPFIRRCYELAIDAGKKGFDTFGALLVSGGKILEEAENTADYDRGLFGHAEFNLVKKCMNTYPDALLKNATLYTSCAPCERCLAAIASLGIQNIVFGVSYQSFALLLPFTPTHPDYEQVYRSMGMELHLTGPVLEDEGMHVFEYWGGDYRPLEELLRESEEMRKQNTNPS